MGCKNLSEIFLQKKITSFIQIGSSAEYGKNKSPQKETRYVNHLQFMEAQNYAQLNTWLILILKKNFHVPFYAFIRCMVLFRITIDLFQ